MSGICGVPKRWPLCATHTIITQAILILVSVSLLLNSGGCDTHVPKDGTARILYQAVYSPCGKPLSKTSSRAVNVAYTSFGHEEDRGLGELDFGARWYNSDLCRFGAVDPVDQPGESSYAYASNNFLNAVDLDGRKTCMRIRLHECSETCGRIVNSYGPLIFGLSRSTINSFSQWVVHLFTGSGSLEEEILDYQFSAGSMGGPSFVMAVGGRVAGKGISKAETILARMAQLTPEQLAHVDVLKAEIFKLSRAIGVNKAQGYLGAAARNTALREAKRRQLDKLLGPEWRQGIRLDAANVPRPTELDNWVKALMNDKQITIPELMERMGVSIRLVEEIRRTGNIPARNDYLYRFAKAVGENEYNITIWNKHPDTYSLFQYEMSLSGGRISNMRGV